MTYIRDLHDVNEEASQQTADDALSDDRKKAVKDCISDIIDGEFDRLESDAAYFITQTAAHRAEKFLERVLSGDAEAFKQLLGNTNAERYKELGYDEGNPWSHLIHGTLFVTNGQELRRQIVEAFPELLSNERIKDLESQVDGLSRQVRQLERELDESRDRR